MSAHLKLASTTAAIALLADPGMAANFEVKMLNKGADSAMVFEPALTLMAAGDTVTFIPTDRDDQGRAP